MNLGTKTSDQHKLRSWLISMYHRGHGHNEWPIRSGLEWPLQTLVHESEHTYALRNIFQGMSFPFKVKQFCSYWNKSSCWGLCLNMFSSFSVYFRRPWIWYSQASWPYNKSSFWGHKPGRNRFQRNTRGYSLLCVWQWWIQWTGSLLCRHLYCWYCW